MIQLNDHSSRRAAQRGLTFEEIEYIVWHGESFHRTGVVIYYLRTKDIPADDLRKDIWSRLVGSAVIVDWNSGTVITVWRNRRSGLKTIRRKPDYSSYKKVKKFV